MTTLRSPSDRVIPSKEELTRELDRAGVTIPGDITRSVVVSDEIFHKLSESPDLQHIIDCSALPSLHQLSNSSLYLWTTDERSALVFTSQGYSPASDSLSSRASLIRMAVFLGVGRFLFLDIARPVSRNLPMNAVISDHVNLLGDNPLIGTNDDRFGVRFPDMSSVYSIARAEEISGVCREREISHASDGVLVGMPNTQELTEKERQALGQVGKNYRTDALIPEIIVAHHAGMEVAALLISRGMDHDSLYGFLNDLLDRR